MDLFTSLWSLCQHFWALVRDAERRIHEGWWALRTGVQHLGAAIYHLGRWLVVVQIPRIANAARDAAIRFARDAITVATNALHALVAAIDRAWRAAYAFAVKEYHHLIDAVIRL